MGATKLLTAAGGGITLDAASTATDKTITVPARTGNMAVDGPAFSAYQSSAQSVSSSTWTKVQFQTEEFDTNSNFDNATNYRFTPTVSGYYQVNLGVQGSASDITVTSIYKNGVTAKEGNWIPTQVRSIASALIYMNGSTDYIEGYVYKSGTSNLSAVSSGTYFQASMVRAA